MKLKNVSPIIALLMVVLVSGCSKDLGPNGSAGMPSDMNSANVNLKSGSLAEVNLGVAGDFVILSKTGVTDVYKSAVLGDVGTSPITGAAMLLKCNEVTGTIYTVDAAGPLPCRVTNATRLGIAVLDMQAAYTELAGRINPDFLNLGAGNIGGKTLTPGLYKWTSPLIIPADITISGGPNDIFVFQLNQTLMVSSAVRMTLAGGVQAKNIFWVSAGAVILGTTSHLKETSLERQALAC